MGVQDTDGVSSTFYHLSTRADTMTLLCVRTHRRVRASVPGGLSGQQDDAYFNIHNVNKVSANSYLNKPKNGLILKCP